MRLKKYLVLVIILLISISSLFKGLFFPYETYIFFSILTGLTALYFLLNGINHGRVQLRHWCVILGILLIGAYCISFSGSVNPRANIDSIIQYTAVFLVFMVLYDYFKDNKGSIPVMVFLPWTGAGFLAAILGMAGYTGAFPVLADTVQKDSNSGARIGSTLQYTNTAAIYFLILIVLTVSMIVVSENLLIKATLAGVSNVFFMALFFTGSRGVFIIVPFLAFILLILSMPLGARLRCAGYILCITLPTLLSMRGFDANSKITNWISASKWVVLSFGISAIAAFIFSIILKLKISLKVKYGVISASVVVLVTMYFINHNKVNSALSAFAANNIPKNILTRIYDINFTTHTVILRFDFFHWALKLIRQNWLLGLGGGGYAALYQSVQDYFFTARLVHNHYLQVFVEAGILGFLSFTLLVLATVVYYILAAIRTKSWKDRVYIAGSLSAFIALATHSAIDFNLSYSSMLLIFWSLIAVGAAYFHNTKNECAGKAQVQMPGDININGNEPNYMRLDNEEGGNIKSHNRVFKFNFRSQSGVASALLLVISMTVMAISGHYISSAKYANLGAEYKEQIEMDKAIESYEKAVKIDTLNPANYAELAELYRWMAYCSKTEDEKNQWLDKAIKSGEEAVRLSPYYPYYRQVLTMAYFDANQPVKAWENAEKLIEVQPKKNDNYELLARGRLEAALVYLRENKPDEAGKLLLRCSEIINYADVKLTPSMAFYIGKARLILGDFTEAEKLLNTARGGSLELKMNSDRLLYIVNEETGRASKNDAYKGVPWMGMVKLTPDYKEIKQILSSKIFEGVITKN